MNVKERESLLKQGSLKVKWPAEPLLGAYYGEEEVEVAVKTIRESFDPTVGFGFICPEIEAFERAFADYCGVKDCVSINGAGSGLDMVMMCLDLEPGDEVICPSVNFRAQPMSIVGQGGTWIPCEIDPVTLQADPNDIEKRITPRTRAIYPVHMNGLSAPMDDYYEIAERHPHPKYGPLKVIGDAARSCGGGYKGTKIGKKGWMTVFSFHTQKLMTTLGEGGAITTDDETIVPRLKAIRQFGWGAGGWGTNYKMTKVQAAVGLVQVKKLDQMIGSRRKVAQARSKMLEGIPGLTLPFEPEGCVHTYYLYTLLVPKEWAGEKRDEFMMRLREEYGVDSVVANPPAHTSIPFLAEHTGRSSLPVSEEIAARLFCVPTHPCMSEEDNAYICAALWDLAEKMKA
ncbi:MAG: DegT/DnrJ/EryC1/StrS family aminotransferase [Armatimonadetes bacterium]|nr:DegT/DnrJ/EryC1/StrS family aminotransferase [Armatimonadota bacterium]